MPKPPNTALRLAVPLFILSIGLGVAYLSLRGTQRQAQQPGQTTPATTPAAPVAQSTPGAPEGAAPSGAGAAAPVAPATAQSEFTPGTKLRARVYPAAAAPVELGDLTPKGPAAAKVTFSSAGAGLRLFALADHFDSIEEKPDQHTIVQAEHVAGKAVTPMAALALQVTLPGDAPHFVNLYADATGDLWRPLGVAGTFEALITDDKDTPVLRVERVYTLRAGSPTLDLRQKIFNLTKTPISIRWFQTGPVDLASGPLGYGGDKRRVRFGYLLSPKLDPAQANVASGDYQQYRSELLGTPEPLKNASGQWLTDANGNAVLGHPEIPLWPNKSSISNAYQLSWLGLTNRYFGASCFPLVDPGAATIDRRFTWVAGVTKVVLETGATEPVMSMRIESNPIALAASGQSGDYADLSMGIYAGPLSKKEINAEKSMEPLGLSGLVILSFGGICGFCTFQPLTSLLLSVMHLLHDHVTRDWSLAIILLVVCVRTLLHPVTRWSQIRLARFGKQMSSMAPKQKLIQEKYKDDPTRMQAEMRKLWAEEGINPAGALGCLPGLLQSPIWYAMSATLFFAVELRHQHGLYGVFQAILPQGSMMWHFLGDLAEPDRFLYFGREIVHLPILGGIDSINILPVVLGVVFYMQQKYLSPMSNPGSMTPEQEFQMKLTKGLMVFGFPLMMYAAPSGLALYFIANSALAIVESRWIRAHMDKHGLLDLDKIRAERNAKRSTKPGQEGFMAKLQRMAEEKQREAARQSSRKK